ncbi:MAG: OmpA family protein [Cytophagales bacterium]
MNKGFIGIILIFFSLTTTTAFCQSVDDNLVSLGDEIYAFGDKKDALGTYLQAVEVNPDNVKANYMVGKCYLETIQKELSVTYLQKAYQLNKDIAPDILFMIANGYQLGSKFEDAINYYKQYKENVNDAKAAKLASTVKDEIIRTDRKIYECINGANYYSNQSAYKIENIKDVINSEYPDYAPAVTADNQQMFFTSRRSGGVGKNKDTDNEFFEDIWTSKKVNGEWTRPKNMQKPINSETHDASIGISPNGKELFLYKPDNGGDIYVSKLQENGQWGSPTGMGRTINSRDKEPSVGISYDGKTLYFSSDRPGGFGGLDIYRSELDKGNAWSKPVNLGSAINTEYDDDSPFIDLDGKTLFFSSRGHKGMGGFDIYRSEFNGEKKVWTEPENMGYPINSPDDDIYFVITGDGKTGYFSSAKGDGFGDKDIYVIHLDQTPIIKRDTTTKQPAVAEAVKKDSLAKKPVVAVTKKDSVATQKPIAGARKGITTTPVSERPTLDKTNKNITTTARKPGNEVAKPVIAANTETFPTVFKGQVADYYSNLPVDAKVVINDLKGNVVNVLDVGEDGSYSTEISQGKPAKYSITVTKQGYIYNNVLVSIPANGKSQKTVVKDFNLRKVSVGEAFILRNIYYDFDKAIIQKQSFQYLDKLVAWAKAHPTVVMEIGGHTDSYGLADYNRILSQKRVDSVMLYLTAKGVNPSHLTAIGYGEDRPLASNDDDPEGREINRRTEFKILKH